ncbi:hypothetical protein DPMN_038201 [Dreissena polymorpha]|uniref:Uncharacterized protein n=1 Tax=Dreissena polymorpha TaxID=45954 RepID=A0A9D4MFW2_DREPO|nr:hypothetical protein DPMN_038201 [Dreissena polymorpha]
MLENRYKEVLHGCSIRACRVPTTSDATSAAPGTGTGNHDDKHPCISGADKDCHIKGKLAKNLVGFKCFNVV